MFRANGNQKKAGIAILISDKIDFKDYYKRQRSRSTLQNNQGINAKIRYKNWNLCTQNRSISIHKATANSHKRATR